MINSCNLEDQEHTFLITPFLKEGTSNPKRVHTFPKHFSMFAFLQERRGEISLTPHSLTSAHQS